MASLQSTGGGVPLIRVTRLDRQNPIDDTQRAKSPSASNSSTTFSVRKLTSTPVTKTPTKQQLAIIDNITVRKNPASKSINKTTISATAKARAKPETTVPRTKLTKPKILPSTKSSLSNSGRSSVTNQNKSDKPKRLVRRSSSSSSSRCSSIIAAQEPQKLRPKRLYYQVTSTPTKKSARSSTEDDLNNNSVQLPDQNVLLKGARQDNRTKKPAASLKSSVGLFSSLTGKR